jgi:membrane-bound ClpP family serine protease
MNNLIIVALLIAGVILGYLLFIVVASHWQKRQGNWPLHRLGVAETPLALTGVVIVAGEAWMAVAIRPIAAGQQVQVIGVDGVMLIVSPKT